MLSSVLLLMPLSMGGLSLVSGFDIWVPSAREGPLIPLNQLGNSNLCDDLRTN